MKQDKTLHDITEQNKTRHNKTYFKTYEKQTKCKQSIKNLLCNYLGQYLFSFFLLSVIDISHILGRVAGP